MKYQIFIFTVILFYGCSNDQYQQKTITAKMIGNQVLIPVTINDTTLYLLWDTGTTSMLLTKDIAKKLNIESDNITNLRMGTLVQYVKGTGHSFDKDTVINVSRSKQILIKVGDYKIKTPFLLDEYGDKLSAGIIGNDVLSHYFYTVNFSDTTFCLSKRPISLVNYAITDSLVLPYKTDRLCSVLCKTTLNGDSVILKFDSGMEGGSVMNWHPMKISLPHDVILTAKDSTDRISRIGRSLNKKKTQFTLHFQNRESEIFCADSLFISSYSIKSYIPYVVGFKHIGHYDGFLSMAFALRFDLFYHDKASQTIKFYKLAGVESKTKEVPLSELFEDAMEFTKKSSKK